MKKDNEEKANALITTEANKFTIYNPENRILLKIIDEVCENIFTLVKLMDSEARKFDRENDVQIIEFILGDFRITPHHDKLTIYLNTMPSPTTALKEKWSGYETFIKFILRNKYVDLVINSDTVNFPYKKDEYFFMIPNDRLEDFIKDTSIEKFNIFLRIKKFGL